MSIRVLVGDCRDRLKELPDESVHCVVTSPPYFGLRDYGCDGQIGLEASPDAFVAEMVIVFRDVRRVLKIDGVAWLNLGDSYASGGTGGASDKSRLNGGKGVGPDEKIKQGPIIVRKPADGLKAKDLIGIPWMVAFALRADGWWLRQDIIWSKPNPMPESVTDRCTKAHEYLFLLSKSERYYFDAAAIAEPSVYAGETRKTSVNSSFAGQAAGLGVTPSGNAIPGSIMTIKADRNKRSVWTVTTQPFSEAHFATFPPALIEPCILAGCPEGGTVLDPFGGAGTTGLVADRLQRNAILIELNPAYAAMAERRIHGDGPLFAHITREAGEAVT